MRSTNLKPLHTSADGRDYVQQAVMLPTKLQRTQALRALQRISHQCIARCS